MRKFRVVVNGEVFEVEVEEISPPRAAGVPAVAVSPRTGGPEGGGGAASVLTPSAPAAPPAPAAAAGPAAPPRPAAPPGAPRPAGVGREVVAEGEAVRAPLPGVIADVKVAVGQEVKAGDVLLVLEAMKMENEVVAPVAGTVRQVLVDRGAAVNAGDPLVVIARS
ncbi:MAG: biotin/lipoyl-binding protein [Firmicutes bacterium]|nr:biotin/lipoyl-binding protein [Bacillota bacterium]